MADNKKHTKPVVVSFAEADAHFEGALSACFQGDYDKVALLPGSLTVDGSLEKAVRALVKKNFDVIAIEGDLKVTGRIKLYEGLPCLYVGGRTTAHTLEGGDCEIYIQDGAFEHFVHGYYNDGILETGTIETPWVINANHDLRVSAGAATRWIDNYGDDDDCDFGSENIKSSFVRAVRDDDGDEVDVDKLYKRLVRGQPVLVDGAKSNRELALAEVRDAKAAGATELEISTTKLKSFPADILDMTQLRKLVLDGNEIGELPEGIGRLAELEELSLQKCSLRALPTSIGMLTKLRVLNIAGNTWVDETGDDLVTRPIRLPEAIGDLASLEELDVSELSHQVDGQDDRTLPDITPFELPASAARLTKLRVLRANHTNLVLPKPMWGASSVRVVEMAGGTWCYLLQFPDWITSLPNLERLELSGNYFPSIPDLSPLQNLEELELGNALCFVKQLPDLSKLPKLRLLNLSGNSDHTGVEVPKQGLLRQLFAMQLSALEDLRIDRWGEEDDVRTHLDPAVIAGIGKLKALKKLDLEFNGLRTLPDDFYELPSIEVLNLSYNRLGKKELKKLAQRWPNAVIDADDQE